MINHEKKRGAMVVALSGELDHRRADQLRPELDDLIRDPKIKELVFDLSNLSFMDSSGIGMILGRYKVMARRGGSVSVKCANAQINRVFELAGLYQIDRKLA